MKLFSFLFVSVSTLVFTQANVSDISLDIPATSLINQGMTQIHFSLADLEIDDIDTITDISFTLPIDTSSSYLDVSLVADTTLDTPVYTLHTNGDNFWTLATSDLSGIRDQLFLTPSFLVLHLSG